MTAPVLELEGLAVGVGSRPVLSGIDLVVGRGEVHVVMGPNGSGKSTLANALAGWPGYSLLEGSARLCGAELAEMAVDERARAGLFLLPQLAIEVPGVLSEEMLAEVWVAEGRDPAGVRGRLVAEAGRLELPLELLERGLNVDLSGGERKRAEAAQLGVLAPALAILDELDTGLDVDALRHVAERLRDATEEDGLAVLAVTHFTRLLDVLAPTQVHVVASGGVRATGGVELAKRIEEEGYAAFLQHA
jgi:Fe-S cluster assembly ATP-binding protein